MDFFRSGTAQLATGDLEKTVSGLALPFTPTQVIVSVRKPSADADLISAVVSGTPTSDGFSVSLSSAVPASGYYLDWCAVSNSVVPSAGDSLAVDYSQLVSILKDFLGFGSTLTEDQANKIDGYIMSGLRQFYYPPKMEGVDESFEWSFLRMSGSVQTTSGVGTYVLADGVGRIAGCIFFDGTDRERRPLPIIPIGDVMSLRRSAKSGYPEYAAVGFANEFGTYGQKMCVDLYPTPDATYTLVFKAEADTGMLNSTTRKRPLGGTRFSELVIESCLAIAEQRANDTIGDHTAKFNQLLVSAIAKDRKTSAAMFGQMGERSEIPPPHGRRYVMGGMKITYHGETW